MHLSEHSTLMSPGSSPDPLDEIRHGVAEISKSLARVENDFAALFAFPVAEVQSDLAKLCTYFGLENSRRLEPRSGRSQSKETRRLEGVDGKSPSKNVSFEASVCERKSLDSAVKRSGSVMYDLSRSGHEEKAPFDESSWESKGVEMPAMYKFWPMGLEPRTVPELIGRSVVSRISRVSTRESLRTRPIEAVSKAKCTLPLDPSSKFVLSMDILGIFFFFYELCVVPITLAWDLHSDLIYIGELSCVSFWVLDLAFGFIVGFFHRGELIMNPLSIALHYLRRGHFLVSLLLVSNDLFILIMDMNDQDVTAMKALHIVKISKIAKLARLAKISYVIQHLNDALGWQRSPATRLFDKFFGAFLFLMVFSHILSCAWYSIGTSGTFDTSHTWLSFIDSHESSVLYQYLVAFEFTLSQITLGQSGVFAENSLELASQCVLLTCGLLFIIVLIAYFSAEMSDLMMSMRGSTQTSLALQFYCVANKVPNALAVRALSQIKERMAMKLQFSDDEQDVSAFAMLSSTLRNEIMRSIQKPHLVMHSLFHIWKQLGTGTLDHLCDSAVIFTTLVPTDELFACGEACSTAYHLVRGQLLYCQSPEDSLVLEPVTTSVYEKTWFCEAALWSLWRHVGRMEAEAYSKVLGIDATALMSVVSQQPSIHGITAEYARDFHKRLICAVPPLAPFPTDVIVPFTESCELLSTHLSILQFEEACKRGRVSIQGLQKAKLRQEIESQRCSIRHTPDKGLTRVVMLTVVQLQRTDGRVYMEVGVIPDGGSEPVCDVRIPGTKRAIGELPQIALERVLSYHFAPFRSNVKTVSTEQEVDVSQTPHFGMTTTFFRAVHYAEWTASCGDIPLRRALLRGQDVAADSTWLPTEQLRNAEVYILPGQRKGTGLYAWLSRDEVAFLKLANHAQDWLSAFEFSHIVL